MVSSADFAAFVQPGETIVNYQIAPDLDGDGIGELVVMNTASMAGDDVISDPVPQIQLGAITVTSQAGTASFRTQQQGFTGRPGDFVEIEATGFNTVSLRSNRVTWTANGTVVEATALASASADGSSQLLAFIVPVLPAGPATVELSNVSTGSAVSLSATIEPVAASTLLAVQLAGSTEGIIDGFMQDSIAFIQGLPTDGLGSADIKTKAVQQFVSVRMDLMIVFNYLEANPVPELEAILDGIAVLIQNSPDLFASGSGFSTQELSPKQKKLIKQITLTTGTIAAALGGFGKFGKIGGVGVWGCAQLSHKCAMSRSVLRSAACCSSTMRHSRTSGPVASPSTQR